MKILPMGVELFYADGLTDMSELIVNFVKAHKKALDKLVFSDMFALNVIHSVVLQPQQTIKLTILSVDHKRYKTQLHVHVSVLSESASCCVFEERDIKFSTAADSLERLRTQFCCNCS